MEGGKSKHQRQKMGGKGGDTNLISTIIESKKHKVVFGIREKRINFELGS